MHLVPTFKLRDVLEENQRNQHIGMYGLASDQSPMIKKTKHWYTFFGREVPIHTGAEELARTYDMGIVYLSIRKERRGYYTASFETFQPQVQGSSNYSIMEAYMKKVGLTEEDLKPKEPEQVLLNEDEDSPDWIDDYEPVYSES